MIVDGKSIATDILATVKAEVDLMEHSPNLTVLTVAPDAATQKFLKLKEKKATFAGIRLKVITLPEEATTAEAVTAIESAVKDTDGMIVQLPLPAQLDQAVIQAAVPPGLDVDATGYKGEDTNILPPVVGAISEIVRRHDLVLADKKIVIVGNGPLVGQPTSDWLLG